ncbi:MAG: hypothetical protein GMKNLPBB_00078 [Myxococcota bacterium]|nr:hypothetical protein [Myxococcota bacterium]
MPHPNFASLLLMFTAVFTSSACGDPGGADGGAKNDSPGGGTVVCVTNAGKERCYKAGDNTGSSGGDASVSSKPDGSTTGASKDAGIPDTGASAGITVTGVVSDGLKGDPIKGAKVCVNAGGVKNCSDSGDDGAFGITGVPTKTELDITAESPDYMIALLSQVGVNENLTQSIVLVPRAILEVYADLVKTTLDSTKGHILIQLRTPSGGFVKGAKASLEPKGGEGPFYTSTQNIPDLKLTESAGGVIFFANLAEGVQAASVFHPSLKCTPSEKYRPGPAPGSVSAPTRPGHVTNVTVECK